MADFIASKVSQSTTLLPATSDSKSYAKLAGSLAFKASPAIMHFGGYQLGRVHEQSLSIVNISNRSQRVHIVAPTTPYFKARYEKKGLVAPGMSEDIIVEFMPTEWRYYYDCIRLHSEKENILIPIHAYPVMNDVVFPKRIDFGVCPLSETATRRVALKCKVPIQFEFMLEPAVTSSPDFYIHPKSGVVPANGQTIITIDYTPVKMTVARMPITVKISQFNFKPFVCEVMGSAAAGLTKEAAMAALEAELIEEPMPPATASPSPSQTRSVAGNSPTARRLRDRESKLLKTTLGSYSKTAKLPGHGIGSGAVRDAGGDAVRARTMRRRERTLARTARTNSSKVEEEEEPETSGDSIVEGVRIPAVLDGPGTTFVLTQQPGKLKPKDLAKAIRQQREQRAKQVEAQEKLRETQGGGMEGRAPGPGLTLQAMEAQERSAYSIIDEAKAEADDAVNTLAASLQTPTAALGADATETGWDIDDEYVYDPSNQPVKGGADDPRRLKEMVFLQDVGDIDLAERQREFQSARQWCGEVQMTTQETQRVMVVRMETRKEAEAIQRDRERRTYTTQALGPFQVPPTRSMAFVRAEPPAVPTFDPYNNDEWQKRAQVLKRLRELVTKSIVRKRATMRLSQLQRRIADAAAAGPEAVKELIERDNRAAQNPSSAPVAAGDGESASWIQGFNLSQDTMQRCAFPDVAAADAAAAAQQVPTSTPLGFQELFAMKKVEVPEQEVMNYKSFPVPVAPLFAPPEEDRLAAGLRIGALEEEAVRTGPQAEAVLDPRLAAAEDTVGLVAPQHTVVVPPPPASLDVLLPDPRLKTLQPMEQCTEASQEYALQASLAKPFSMMPHRATLPPPPPEAGSDGATTVITEDPSMVPRAMDAAAEDGVYMDLNGLIPTAGQVGAVSMRSSSLRAMLPVKSLSQVWRPRRERVYPALDGAHPWEIPHLPKLLHGPAAADELSDDSESDVEDEHSGPTPTMEAAMALFAGGKQAEDEEEKAAGDDKKAGAAEDEDADGEGKTDATGNASELPRDRARLVLAAVERKAAVEAADWLDTRLKTLDGLMAAPQHRFSFDEHARVRWAVSVDKAHAAAADDEAQ